MKVLICTTWDGGISFEYEIEVPEGSTWEVRPDGIFIDGKRIEPKTYEQHLSEKTLHVHEFQNGDVGIFDQSDSVAISTDEGLNKEFAERLVSCWNAFVGKPDIEKANQEAKRWQERFERMERIHDHAVGLMLEKSDRIATLSSELAQAIAEINGQESIIRDKRKRIETLEAEVQNQKNKYVNTLQDVFGLIGNAKVLVGSVDALFFRATEDEIREAIKCARNMKQLISEISGRINES